MPRSHPATLRADVYSRITTEIVSAIEAGAGDWRMPWHHDGAATTRPQNVTSRRRYRGINVLALWIAAEASGDSSGLWGSYRQWAALGAQVRKGERGATVVFWKQTASRADDGHSDGEAGSGRMFARAFTVFNLAQVEGYEPAPVAVLPESEKFAHAEAFVAALKIPITEVTCPPVGPAVITRVRRFDIRARPPAQARRAGRYHLAGTPGALVPAFGSPGMSAA